MDSPHYEDIPWSKKSEGTDVPTYKPDSSPEAIAEGLAEGWIVAKPQYEPHPYADLFPYLSEPELADLANDIAENGLREPIVLYRGEILDGRNRYKACLKAGVEPTFIEFEGDDEDALKAVLSWNLHRRHLTSSQLAVIALDVLPVFEALARHRQRLAGGDRGNQYTKNEKTDGLPLVERFPQAANNPKARDEAAAAVGTNSRYVSDAKRLNEQAPELLDLVRNGQMSLPQAKQLATLSEADRQAVMAKALAVDPDKRDQVFRKEVREAHRQQRRFPVTETPLLPDGKFRVVYADPPWQYNNSGVINDGDNYGRAERHYPTLPLPEICALGEELKPVLLPDSVLFLWATSPLLPDAFEVIEAWGFTYKTSIVWDKVRHNYGHYVSVRHEFLLICTRGACTPDNPELTDSVVSIERSTKHSEKPAYFRELIERLYPVGDRLELFARSDAEGWQRWGNQ